MFKKTLGCLVMVGCLTLPLVSICWGGAHPGWEGKCAQSYNQAPGCDGYKEPPHIIEPNEIDWANDPLIRMLTAPWRWISEGIDNIKKKSADKRRADTKLGDEYKEQAYSAKNNGDYKLALKLYKQALATYPNPTSEYRQYVAEYERDAERQDKIAKTFDRIVDAVGDNRPVPSTPGLVFSSIENRGDQTSGASELDFLPAKSAEQTYVPSGNGLIGGTAWIVGYNVPPNANPALKAKAIERLRQISTLAGMPYNEAINFEHYNFVLGVAISTEIFTDLRKRVLFDELKNGRKTTHMQNAYNSIKGRSFEELVCHSNGAMICLAALENHDIIADRVVLYGPQITMESLEMWQKAIMEKKVKSVQIYINQNDPVPAVSMLLATLSVPQAIVGLPLFNVDVMRDVIQKTAPGIGVKTFSCSGSVLSADCHDLRAYNRDRGCKLTTSSGKTVPGTALPGDSGVLEPPSPCL